MYFVPLGDLYDAGLDVLLAVCKAGARILRTILGSAQYRVLPFQVSNFL